MNEWPSISSPTRRQRIARESQSEKLCATISGMGEVLILVAF